MNKLDVGGWARPFQERVEPGSCVYSSDLTWLDECAMRAMAICFVELPPMEIAVKAYEIARAMLAEKRRLEGGGK